MLTLGIRIGDRERLVCRNPQPCPLLYATNPGDPSPAGLARDSDVRSDLPRYLVRNGDETLETKEITKWWNHDSVALFLGCSFGFEVAPAMTSASLSHVVSGCIEGGRDSDASYRERSDGADVHHRSSNSAIWTFPWTSCRFYASNRRFSRAEDNRHHSAVS